MLTKEEANSILKIIGGIVGYVPKCNNCFHTGITIRKVSQKIQDLTEKPKREIQVGDIYLNNEGNICIISDPQTDHWKYTTPAHEVFVKGQGGYLKSGEPHERYTCHLILSKRYKLVEIDDVND